MRKVPKARTRQLGPVVGLATVLLLGGCALPDGVDGDLTGGWSAMPEPVVFQPDPATCHQEHFSHNGPMSGYRPVPCERHHMVETVHVGAFVDEAADRVTPPPAGSPEMREAYGACEAAAAEYLGADFRYGPLWLGVVRPSRYAWEGGARWFRCDVGMTSQPNGGGGLVGHDEGSLRGALADGSELALGCFRRDDDDDGTGEMVPVDCDEPHSVEFAGVWTAPDTSYPADDEDGTDRIHRACRSVVAEYVGVPDDANMQYRTGTIFIPMGESDWQAGDRGFRCFLWLSDHELTESLAGAGESGMPIR